MHTLLGYRVWASIGIARALMPGGLVEPVIVYRGRVYSLSSWGYTSLKEFMVETPPEETEKIAHRVSRHDQGVPLGGVRLLAPIERPTKIIAVGLNYKSHAEEVGMKPPSVPELFVKTPNTIIGPGDPIVIHNPNLMVDAEAELAVVIGLPGRGVAESDAESIVWGYMCFNDVSERREQLLSGVSQWWKGKSRDTYSPTGPLIVPRTQLNPRKGLRLTLTITGERLQDGNTLDMIFTVETIVSYASRGILLEPGDIVATGTPSGVGFTRKPPRLLKGGDIVEVCIEGIGCIENPVIEDLGSSS